MDKTRAAAPRRTIRARIARWICQCGAINPETTASCLRCG